MIAGLCEAGLCASAIDRKHNQPLFANPTPHGRGQEIIMQKQVLQAGSPDDVIELGCTFDLSERILPDKLPPSEDIPEDINWTKVLVRSRSDDNTLRSRRIESGGPVKRERIKRTLLKPNTGSHAIHWPPLAADANAQLPGPRERTNTDASEVEHPGLNFRLRIWSDNAKLARSKAGIQARTMLSSTSEHVAMKDLEEIDQKAIVAANQALSRELVKAEHLTAAYGEQSPYFPILPGSPGPVMAEDSLPGGVAANEYHLPDAFNTGLRLMETNESDMFSARLSTLLHNLAGANSAVGSGKSHDLGDHSQAIINDSEANLA